MLAFIEPGPRGLLTCDCTVTRMKGGLGAASDSKGIGWNSESNHSNGKTPHVTDDLRRCATVPVHVYFKV
jgi:hypothetical protein